MRNTIKILGICLTISVLFLGSNLGILAETTEADYPDNVDEQANPDVGYIRNPDENVGSDPGQLGGDGIGESDGEIGPNKEEENPESVTGGGKDKEGDSNIQDEGDAGTDDGTGECGDIGNDGRTGDGENIGNGEEAGPEGNEENDDSKSEDEGASEDNGGNQNPGNGLGNDLQNNKGRLNIGIELRNARVGAKSREFDIFVEDSYGDIYVVSIFSGNSITLEGLSFGQCKVWGIVPLNYKAENRGKCEFSLSESEPEQNITIVFEENTPRRSWGNYKINNTFKVGN